MFWYLNAANGAKALADVPFQNYLEPRWHRIIPGLKIIRIKAKVPKTTAAASGTQFLLSISDPRLAFTVASPREGDVYNFVRLVKNPVTCGLSCRHIVHMRS
jgi:hypothetical protein